MNSILFSPLLPHGPLEIMGAVHNWVPLYTTSLIKYSTTPLHSHLFRFFSRSPSRKQNTNTVHSSLSDAALCLVFPPNWVAIPTHWFDRRHSQFISFTAVCVQQYARSHTRLCIRFSGITQGGKHRLIRSSSSSLVNTPLHSLLSYHCCDTVRCLLINSIQGMHKQMPLEAVIYLISRDNATKQVKLMFEDVLEHLNSEYESFRVSPVRLHAMSDIHVCIL